MRVPIAGLIAIAASTAAYGQPTVTAFVNVTLVPMDGEHVKSGYTVVVRGDRIAAIGRNGTVSIPSGALVVEGAGKYLAPGLVDAHVHLAGTVFAPSRPDFGDAPLYLAYGVTTVLNLRGTPEHLAWKRRVEAGELPAPTIYTSGEFVNEPRVRTVEEVQQEVAAHARQGYDIIKFREVMDASGRFTATKTGLSLEAYRKLNEAARAAGMPLVGHAPVGLGLDALLEARQNLAHTGALSNIYFLPFQSRPGFVWITAASFAVLLALGTVWGCAAAARRFGRTKPVRPPPCLQNRKVCGWVLGGGGVAILSAALLLPGGPLFDSLALRLLFSAAAVVVAAAAAALVRLTAKMWREGGAKRLARLESSAASTASVALACVLVLFWLPVVWRSSDAGIERLARRLREAGISAQTTLIVYGFLSGPERLRLMQEPAMEYLDRAVREQWRRLPRSGRPAYRYHLFMRKVTAALHRAGVPLIAGTDAMGLPLIVPGASLHRELTLLEESGLTPYEAIRTATVNPAVFLGKEREFGTIAEGKRADLVLVEGNPLEKLSHLQRLAGVMVRGKWLTREDLQQRLAKLRN